MSDIVDGIVDFFEEAIDALVGVVEDIWNEIVAPLAEEIFNWLGFEDQTIITSYVVASSLYGDQTYVNPFKKIPINRATYGTEVYDEIMNIFLTGEHVRIRFYMRRIELYGRTPTSSVGLSTIDEVEIQSIIEGIEGEPITILRSALKFPTTLSYIRSWLIDNAWTLGYIYKTAGDALTTPSGTYLLNKNDPYTYDAINDTWDVNFIGSLKLYVINSNAVNTLAAPASTYEESGPIAGTAVNRLASPASTYAEVTTTVLTVTVDTGVDDHEPAGSVGAQRVIVDTGVDAAVPTQDAATQEMDSGLLTLDDLVPVEETPGKRFEVEYTIDSDTAQPKAKHWWFYELEPEPRTYPDLYPTLPIFPGAEKQTVLPIVPLKLDTAWIHNRAKDDPDRKEVTRAMRRYGMSLLDIGRSLEKDPAGNDPDITSAFFLFGINIGTCASQVELDYLFNMFIDYAVYQPDLVMSEYQAETGDIALVKSYIDGRSFTPVSKGNDQNYWTLAFNDDPDRIIELMTQYIDPLYADWYDYYSGLYDPLSREQEWTYYVLNNSLNGAHQANTLANTIGPALDDLYDTLKANQQNNLISFTIAAGAYNITVAYGASEVTTYAGTVGDGTVGNCEKEIIAEQYQLKLRKQTDVGIVTQVWFLDLMAFCYVPKDGASVYYTPLDFIGSDVGGVNVANNFVMPITYGYMLELGIIDRKELLYRAAHIKLYGVNVVNLRYYETAQFGRFLGLVLKVVAVVILIFSLGTASDISAILWSAAKYYGSKLIAEYAIQQLLLSDPDNPLALALAVGIAIWAGSSDAVNIAGEELLTQALIGISAVSQVTTQYTAIKSAELLSEQQDFLESAKEQNERLQQAIDNQDIGSDALLDYIKKTITMKFTDPSTFYEHRLTRNLVDQALDLDRFEDVEALLDLVTVNREIL